ncbi:MAG: YbaB/EbfC family nucleoid-associated protein [Lentisphaerae bacterium]|jgi:DNA-binding protein YbaB|nr:YbaB/EbfC family nucleoid-associated protein [Lentisphaerota bacterium]
MANMFDQVKQAMQMRKEAKRLQAEVEKITFEYSNAGITCIAKGDFSIASIKITPEAIKEIAAGKPDRFETMLHTVVNGALKGVRKQTQEAMTRLMKDSGMGGMLGGLGM